MVTVAGLLLAVALFLPLPLLVDVQRQVPNPRFLPVRGANSVAVHAYFEQTGERGICLPDPVAMSILLDPGLCSRSSEHYVEIETRSELTRGMTVVDRLNVAHDPRNERVWAARIEDKQKIRICWELDIAGWKTALLRALH